MATNRSLARRAASGGDAMSALDQAADIHRDLVSRESRGYGDTHNAMRRLEPLGLPYWTQWNLRAGKLTGDGAALLARVRAAYRAWLARRVAADLEILRALEADGDAHATRDVVEAEALLAELGVAAAPSATRDE